jgi:hypothetical protein
MTIRFLGYQLNISKCPADCAEFTIEIDNSQRERQVADIEDSEFFQRLLARKAELKGL